MTALTGSGTSFRSWRPSKRTEGITAEVAVKVAVDTYVVIEAIYVLEFSFGLDQASVVCPLRGGLKLQYR